MDRLSQIMEQIEKLSWQELQQLMSQIQFVLHQKILDEIQQRPKDEAKEKEDKEYQLNNLKEIYEKALYPPIFKNNPKYCVGKFANLTAYISYEDIMNYKYIIRARDWSSCDSTVLVSNEGSEIIKEYDNMESLIDDGWELD
jgi:hypothetical protein